MMKQTFLIFLALALFLPMDRSAGMAGRHKLRQMRKQAKALDTHIVFYGVVVDDDGNPIPDAQVQIHYRHYSPKHTGGTGKIQVSTDEAGNFVVKGIRGRQLFVNRISKFGYEFTYTGANYHYASAFLDKIHSPDRENPEKFILRKKNPPTLVLPRKHSKQFKQSVSTMFYDASERALWTKQISYTPIKTKDLVVSALRDPQNKKWIVTFEAPNPEDGLSLSNEKLFTVPSSGLTNRLSVVVTEGPPGQPFHLYVKSRQGSVYTGLDGTLYAWPNLLNFNFDSRTNPEGNPNIDFYEEVFADFLEEREAEKARVREERKKNAANK